MLEAGRWRCQRAFKNTPVINLCERTVVKRVLNLRTMEQLKTRSVLLLEDEPIIAMDVEYWLRDAGFEVAGSFCSYVNALDWLKSEEANADIAVLDIVVRDRDCLSVAQILQERGIPFIVDAAGTNDPDFHNPVFAKSKWLSKPSDLVDVVTTLKTLLTHREALTSA